MNTVRSHFTTVVNYKTQICSGGNEDMDVGAEHANIDNNNSLWLRRRLEEGSCQMFASQMQYVCVGNVVFHRHRQLWKHQQERVRL